MSHTKVGAFVRSTGNRTASSQTNFLRNYHLLMLAVLIRHIRISALPSLQQQKRQYHLVVRTTTGHAGKRRASTYTSFFWQGRVWQLMQLEPLCFLGLTKQWKNRWYETVNFIDFTYLSWLAWNTINNLTGRTRHPHRSCPSLPIELLRNWCIMAFIRPRNTSQ